MSRGAFLQTAWVQYADTWQDGFGCLRNLSISVSEGALLTLAPALITGLKSAFPSGIPCISHCPSSILLTALMQLIFRSTSSARGSGLLYLYLVRAWNAYEKGKGKGRAFCVLSLLVCSEKRQWQCVFLFTHRPTALYKLLDKQHQQSLLQKA